MVALLFLVEIEVLIVTLFLIEWIGIIFCFDCDFFVASLSSSFNIAFLNYSAYEWVKICGAGAEDKGVGTF